MNSYKPRIIRRERYAKETTMQNVVAFSLRGELTWRLIEHFGAVAGKRWGGAQSSEPKDPGVELQTPQELVDRCFEITDIFLTRCEATDQLVPIPEDSEE